MTALVQSIRRQAVLIPPKVCGLNHRAAAVAAMVATLYIAIPAVIVAYGWHWLFESSVS